MNNVKSVKGIALASLLLFLGAWTLTPEPIRLSKTLWNMEAQYLVTYLTLSNWPENVSIPEVEAAFELAPMMSPHQGLAVEIIRDHYVEKSILDGQLRMPFGENTPFHYYPSLPNSLVAERVKSYQAYEKLYVGTNEINYAEYDIASLAFPGKWHKILLADGYILWSGVANKVEDGWTVVGDKPPLYIPLDEVKEKIIKDAIPWAGVQKDFSNAYFETLKAYRSQELTLPVVGAKIPWSIAGVALVLTALYISVLFVHSMFRLRDSGVELDEPWLLVEPCKPEGRLENLLFKSMTIVGGLVLMLLMSMPVATIILVSPTINNWVFAISMSITVLLALLGLRELFRVARRGEFSHRRELNETSTHTLE